MPTRLDCTYEGWKLDFDLPFGLESGGWIAPMRDGNNHGAVVVRWHPHGWIAPMRDGNVIPIIDPQFGRLKVGLHL